VWREVLFCRHVMVPLLGSCYLQPPAAARIDSSEVRQLSANLQSQRPGQLFICQIQHQLSARVAI
jgi:hypothetical protein